MRAGCPGFHWPARAGHREGRPAPTPSRATSSRSRPFLVGGVLPCFWNPEDWTWGEDPSFLGQLPPIARPPCPENSERWGCSCPPPWAGPQRSGQAWITTGLSRRGCHGKAWQTAMGILCRHTGSGRVRPAQGSSGVSQPKSNWASPWSRGLSHRVEGAHLAALLVS